MSKPIPPLKLEQALLGELSPQEFAACVERYGPDFERELARMRARDESWSALPERELEIAQIKARVAKAPAPRRASPRALRWGLLPAAACACALLLFVVRQDEAPRDTPQPDQDPASQGVRFKGLAPHLTLHRKTADGQEKLDPGSLAQFGDLIQLSYVAAGARFGVVVSVDGRGQATLHYPIQVQQPSALRSGAAVPLTQAYELDDAPDFERFFFVTSRQDQEPQDFARRVLDLASAFAKGAKQEVRSADLPLPQSWAQADFLLAKQPAQ